MPDQALIKWLRLLCKAHRRAMALAAKQRDETVVAELAVMAPAIERLGTLREERPLPESLPTPLGVLAMRAALAWVAAEVAGDLPHIGQYNHPSGVRKPREHMARLHGVSVWKLSKARAVLRHVPDLVPAVLAQEMPLLAAYSEIENRREGHIGWYATSGSKERVSDLVVARRAQARVEAARHN